MSSQMVILELSHKRSERDSHVENQEFNKNILDGDELGGRTEDICLERSCYNKWFGGWIKVYYV